MYQLRCILTYDSYTIPFNIISLLGTFFNFRNVLMIDI